MSHGCRRGLPSWIKLGTLGATVAILALGCWEDTPGDQTFDDASFGDTKLSDSAVVDCPVGTRRCSADGTPEQCRPGAGWIAESPCTDAQTCEEGQCIDPVICTPNESRCKTETLLEVCVEDGTAWETTTCGDECNQPAGGMATCDDIVCIPGERTCNGTDVIVECSADGLRFDFVERCNGRRTGKQCDRGECIPLCILSEKVKTNIGCDYWAVDLDNAFVPGGNGFLDAAAAPFAVVVSNPHPDFTGEVSVLNDEETVETAIIPPLGLHVFNLPRRDVDGTVQAKRAYRVRSSIPIVAYQFNPLDNENVFSNDASLLLPSHVVGDRYYIMTREQSFERLRGYLTVVGISEEPTQVSVTLSAPTQPGVNSIPGMEAGDVFETVLEQFEVLNIETQAPGADLTGSLVVASQNVVVFGGSEAANVPNTNHCIEIDPVLGTGVCEAKRDVPCETNYDCNAARLNTCCADHLEQQLFPVNTWGRHYIATKSFDRGLENDYWRILASEDETKVETVPPQVPIPVLNAGEWFEFKSREHFEIISDKPVLIGQFLASEQAPNPNFLGVVEPGDADTGDPAFILAVPVEQFREDFVFLAPDKYAFDYVSVLANIETEVFFDELPVPEVWEPVGDGSQWRVARFAIGDGVHFITATQPVGVIVYGYDQFVSYGYPGGLNLDVVDPETGMDIE